MRVSRNKPRSRHKLAEWEQEMARLQRAGLISEEPRKRGPRVQSRSLSLRATSFVESQIRRTELSDEQVRRPRQFKADRFRNRAAIAAAQAGDRELFELITRS